MSAIAIPNPIPARHKNVNRAEVCDQNFVEFVQSWQRRRRTARRAPTESPVLPGSLCTRSDFIDLFESQLIRRHLDLMARVLRVKNKVFYTIGSCGHEGNAMVARLTRHTDPAFLHYRSGAFMAERFRKLPGMDPIMDSALSFAASKDDPASGGRHKVWGSKPLWVLPQTSTIASHLPKALGTAVAIEQAQAHRPRAADSGRFDRDLLVRRRVGESCDRADRIQHRAVDRVPETAGADAVRLRGQRHRHLGEDAGATGSARVFAAAATARLFLRPTGSISPRVMKSVARAVHHCRTTRRPTFLHLRTTRIMGHAGTDFEIEWRSVEELVAVEASDPLLRSAAIALEAGV